jgi:hypothetical protein
MEELTMIIGVLSIATLVCCISLLLVMRHRLNQELREIHSLTILMTSLAIGITETLASGQRMEQTAANVAQDLSDAHARADAVTDNSHGAAADAASRQTEKEKMRNNNPHEKRTRNN